MSFEPIVRFPPKFGLCLFEQSLFRDPRLQILTIAELFQKKRPDISWVDASMVKKAKREDTTKQEQLL